MKYTLFEELRMLMAEVLCSWACSLMPNGPEKVALATALVGYLRGSILATEQRYKGRTA